MLRPKCSSNSNTAPAHLHTTGEAKYPALLSQEKDIKGLFFRKIQENYFIESLGIEKQSTFIILVYKFY